MNTDNYKKKFSGDESKVVAIDFDGVIHDHNLGFHDGTIYGNPLEGALESIKTLSDMGFTIKIYSCKCHPDRPLINGMTGAELLQEWLEKNEVMCCIDEIVWGKPHAMVYIDDKGYRFENWKDTMTFMRNLV